MVTKWGDSYIQMRANHKVEYRDTEESECPFHTDLPNYHYMDSDSMVADVHYTDSNARPWQFWNSAPGVLQWSAKALDHDDW